MLLHLVMATTAPQVVAPHGCNADIQQYSPLRVYTERRDIKFVLASGRAVGAAGTGEAAGDTEGWPSGEDGSTCQPAGGGCATDDAMSTARGQVKVGDNSGDGVGKGFFRPVCHRWLKWQWAVLPLHDGNQERCPVLQSCRPSRQVRF